jgi:hypothetical protein
MSTYEGSCTEVSNEAMVLPRCSIFSDSRCRKAKGETYADAQILAGSFRIHCSGNRKSGLGPTNSVSSTANLTAIGGHNQYSLPYPPYQTIKTAQAPLVVFSSCCVLLLPTASQPAPVRGVYVVRPLQ